MRWLTGSILVLIVALIVEVWAYCRAARASRVAAPDVPAAGRALRRVDADALVRTAAVLPLRPDDAGLVDVLHDPRDPPVLDPGGAFRASQGRDRVIGVDQVAAARRSRLRASQDGRVRPSGDRTTR